jgi:hypothetical protein
MSKKAKQKRKLVIRPVNNNYLWGSSFRVSRKPHSVPIKAPTPVARTYAPISAIPAHRPIRCIPTRGAKKTTVVESTNELAVAAVEMLIA